MSYSKEFENLRKLIEDFRDLLRSRDNKEDETFTLKRFDFIKLTKVFNKSLKIAKK